LKERYKSFLQAEVAHADHRQGKSLSGTFADICRRAFIGKDLVMRPWTTALEVTSESVTGRKRSISQGARVAKLERRLAQSLETVISPERVKLVKITKAKEDVVTGFVLTHCPVEGIDHWKDFEAHMKSGRGASVRYVIVDGRRLGTAVSGR
jgi:hypothetical protein